MAEDSVNEKVDMLKCYFSSNYNSRQALQLYQQQYPNRFHPRSSYFFKLERKLRRTGSLSMKKYESREINENIEVDLLTYFNVYPRNSIREAALEFNISHFKGIEKPFTEVIKANIGDCHAMGQTPITFLRQVLALASYPELFQDPSFPNDAKSRACAILKGCKGGSVGSYSDSPGIEIIRRHVSQYIEKRDEGIPSDWENVILISGATDGIKNLLKLFICDINGKKPGVMVPVPQFPLYSATIAEFNMEQIDYYLDEKNSWALNLSELQRALDESKKNSVARVIVVINPGNPTGQVLSRDNIEEIIKFAHKNKLFIFADEVYQDNIYADECKFYSFKKVLTEMGEPYNKMELASFMSCSKGYMGECGLRGGYVEIINMCPEVKAMYLKAISAMLCPTVLGQCVTDVIVNPPQPGEPSYDLFIQEKTGVLESLKLRAKMVTDTFNTFRGFSCNPVQGAMYAFPQIKFPRKAIEASKAAHQAPDVFYAFQVLENTGICIVPGCGFGQQPGTYHFRTTILPQPEKLKLMLEKFKIFHESFYKKYCCKSGTCIKCVATATK